jgi:uncharacterized membrane protein (DUF2068 family)
MPKRMLASLPLCKLFVTRAGLEIPGHRATVPVSLLPPPQVAPMKAVPVPAFVAAHTENQTLFVIGVFKIIKATLFLVAALSVFHIVHKDTQIELRQVLHAFRISGDREFVKQLLLKANVVTTSRKEFIGCILALYAALFATEGTGLMLRKRWAEWFTAIMTSTGVPIEVYEMFHKANALKLAALVINILIVLFLIVHLRGRTRRVTLVAAVDPECVSR